jgi:hypothetical protein
MSTNDVVGRSQASRATRWTVPGLAVVIGAGYLVAGVVGGDVAFGVGGLVVMLLAAAGFVLLARRSELVAGLADRNDERINSIDGDATRFAGVVVTMAVLGMFIVEIANGNNGSPYAQLAGLGGVSYIAAIVWLRFRR